MGDQQVKVMRLRYAAICGCGTAVAEGARAGYDSTVRNVICLHCLDIRRDAADTPTLAILGSPNPMVDVDVDFEVEKMSSDEMLLPTRPVDIGAPGASLDREYYRRKDARDARVRSNHPHIGGLVLALSHQPQSTTAFATGATGERRLAARLEHDCANEVLFLHNRKLGRSRRDGDIDHIAIAPSGVYVIDAKHYAGATVEVRTSSGWLSDRVETLYVAGRDHTNLLIGLNKQRLAVNAATAHDGDEPAIEIFALLCFVNANLPRFTTLRVDDIPILSPRATSKLLRRPGPLDQQTRERLHHYLAERLPTA